MVGQTGFGLLDPGLDYSVYVTVMKQMPQSQKVILRFPVEIADQERKKGEP